MYIDAYFDREDNKVKLVERKNGKRIYREIKPDNHFFVEDARGTYKTIFGTPVKKVSPKSHIERARLLKRHPVAYESDIDPILRTLELNYLNCDVPKPNVAFFDIETDFCKTRGYAPPHNPFNGITSIAVYSKWSDSMVCLAVPPKTLTWEQAEEIASNIEGVVLCSTEEEMLRAFLEIIEDADVLSAWNGSAFDIPYVVNRIKMILGPGEETKLCLWGLAPKASMVLMGNKEIPSYDLSGRIHLDLMDLYKKYTYEQKQSYALDSIAEIELGEKKVQYEGTLDNLYNNDFSNFLKYNIQDTLLLEKLEDKLQYIALCNLIAHTNCVLIPTALGTVKMIDQALTLEAHSKNLVVPNKAERGTDDTRAAGGWVANPKKGLHKWMGSSDLNSLYPSILRALNMSPETLVGQIRLTKTMEAINEFVNSENNKRTQKKNQNIKAWEQLSKKMESDAACIEPEDIDDEDEQEDEDDVSGYYDGEISQDGADDSEVVDEFFVGTKADKTFARWWNDRFCPLEMHAFLDGTEENITLDMEDGQSYELTGKELRELIFGEGSTWHISANGTIFRNDIDGIVPSLLTRWYAERKVMQRIHEDYVALDGDEKGSHIKVDSHIFCEDDIDHSMKRANSYDINQAFTRSKYEELLKTNDIAKIRAYLNSHRLTVVDGRLRAIDMNEHEEIKEFWDKRQLVKKILLNSSYGALLNPWSRFFDQRIGQSTTLTGRNISRHMAAKTNEFFTGIYDYKGETCVYGDTDSVYFSAYNTFKPYIDSGEVQWDVDSVIKLYDDASEQTSDSFPEFLKETFNIPISRSEGVIKSAREMVASTALFVKKKRYAAMMLDNKGKRYDVNGEIGKIKVTGLDLRRSDTPKFVQKFLKDCLTDLLSGKDTDSILDDIRNFKTEFNDMDPWMKGKPSSANGLSHYTNERILNIEKKKKGKKGFTPIPGHISGAIYWNLLRESHNSLHVSPILDGQKVIVCRLREQKYSEWKNISFPIDEVNLPEWFKELDFDNTSMLNSIVNKKLENLFGVLGLNLKETDPRFNHTKNIFKF